MNQTIHDAIVSAVECVIRQGDTDNQVTEWMTVLRKINEDMLLQTSMIQDGMMFDALIRFRVHNSFDQWSKAWRIEQFNLGGRMHVDLKTGRPTFLFNDGPNTRDIGWFCEVLSDNPAFSIGHEEMLVKYDHYKNDLNGNLNGHSRGQVSTGQVSTGQVSTGQVSTVQVSTVTSDFLNSLRGLWPGVDLLFDALSGLTMKTFMEYIAFLIDETNFTTVKRSRAHGSVPQTGWDKYHTTKKTMDRIDWPKLFFNEDPENIDFNE